MFDDDDDINESGLSGQDDADDLAAGGAADNSKDDTPDVDVSPANFPDFDDETGNESHETEDETHQEEAQDPNTIMVQPVQFASFEDLDQVAGPQNQNLNILLDVKLQLSVELGRTDLPIKKVLELTKGSIVTLNKAAGEPVELYANGKLIAFGEVVVIEDNFGLRITHITDPVKRLNTINGGARED
jgi:flagellar motor switch protein FliN/FliY